MKLDEMALEAATDEIPVYVKREARKEIAETTVRAYLEAATPPDVAELIAELADEADLCRNETATDIADLLDRAATALRLSAGGGWRPMESAPPNQTVILGWHDWRDGQWCMEIGAASTGHRYDTGFSSVSRHGSATHWLPLSFLPASPTVEDGHVE